MNVLEICLIIFIGIYFIAIISIIWTTVDDYYYEERQERKKARLRKTKGYKLGREEAWRFSTEPYKVKRLNERKMLLEIEIDTLKSEKDNLMRTLEEAQEKIMELENELFDLEEEYGISRDDD